MTPHEFNDALDVLGYSQCEFARSLGINDRTVRRWSSGDVPVPGPIVFALKQMSRQGDMMFDEADIEEIQEETKSEAILAVLQALIAQYGLAKVTDCFAAVSE